MKNPFLGLQFEDVKEHRICQVVTAITEDTYLIAILRPVDRVTIHHYRLMTLEKLRSFEFHDPDSE